MWSPISYLTRKINTYTSLVNTPPADPRGPRRNVLVIHCHPRAQSFSTAISNTVVTSLQEAGHTVRLRRLYFHGNESECYQGKTFNPVLTATEREEYNDPSKLSLRQTNEGLKKCASVTTDVVEAVSDLRWCDSLVLIYPTWWFNFPAVMKGYIDRVMLPGVAFAVPKLHTIATNNNSNNIPSDNDNNNNNSMNRRFTKSKVTGLVPMLTNITKIGVVTTYGASKTATFVCGTR